MDKIQQIVRLMVQKLINMPNGTETSVSDILNQVLTPVDDELTLDDFFEIDALFRRKAIEAGIILDSMKHDFNPGLAIDRTFIVRKFK